MNAILKRKYRRFMLTGVLVFYIVAVFQMLQFSSGGDTSTSFKVTSRRFGQRDVNSSSGARPVAMGKINTDTEAVKAVERGSLKYDVIINSYMRAGSSFLGELLGFQENAFYLYEPIWNFHAHYWGNDVICPGNDPCRSVRESDVNISTIQFLIGRFFSCSLTSLVPLVYDKHTGIYSGLRWNNYMMCRRKGINQTQCLKELQPICSSSEHRITKVIRLTVDNTERHLADNPHLKVIHMFRDPRAVINSRITTSWHVLKMTPNDGHRAIRIDAKDLCDRMLYDLRAGIELKRKYPSRFAFVFNEDIIEDLNIKAKWLYEYLGMNTENLDVHIKKLTSKGKHTKKTTGQGFGEKWKTSLTQEVIKVVDSECADIYSKLGYIQTQDTSQLKDSAFKTYNFTRSFLLKNIWEPLNYDFMLERL